MGQLSAFLQRLTNTPTQRWQRAKQKVGYGHLYQGRFKSFPVETDEHFYTVVRYQYMLLTPLITLAANHHGDKPPDELSVNVA